MTIDLVKRYSSYNIMMLGDSGNEVSTPDGEWVKYKDYKAQADHIEELEAKLAKAIDFVAEVGGGFKFGESLVDWANLHVLKARTLLAEISKERSDEKGEVE